MSLLGLHVMFPLAGLLLLVVPLVLRKAAEVGSHTLSPKRKKLLAAIRATLLALVCLALMSPRTFVTGTGSTVFFVLDVSESAGGASNPEAVSFLEESVDALPESGKAALVLFGKTPVLAVSAEKGLQRETLSSALSAATELDRSASDPARALRLALASFPQGQQRRVVLLTDGNETSGDLAAVAREAAQQGIEVAVVPLRNAQRYDVAVQGVELLTRNAGTTETIEGRVSISASAAGTGSLLVSLDDKEIARVAVTLAAGNNGPFSFQYPLRSDEGGDLTFSARYVDSKGPEAEATQENNRALGYVNVSGRPRVLLLTADTSKQDHLRRVLEAEDFVVDLRDAAKAPTSLVELMQYDVLALVDMPFKKDDVQYLTEDQDKLFASYVKDYGGGLVMIGGDRSFGPGGWENTAVSEVLPVDIDGSTEVEEPTLAVLFILDRSGSMSEVVSGGYTKMDLADQAAVAAMQTLSEDDLLGVAEVDTEVYWTVNLQPVKDKEKLARAILSIRSQGGGIYVYTSLLAAHEKLKTVEAGVKHVILFTDTADSEEQCKGVEYGSCPGGVDHSYDVADRMVRDQITVSVIGIGRPTDSDTEFDRQLARRGKGRFYLTSDATDLRRIFLQETRTVGGSSLDEFAFTPQVKLPSPITKGIDFVTAPQLLGMVQTQARETAETILVAPSGNPVLAIWRYGLGLSMAFTSDATDRWAKNWISWSGYARFWTQAFRSVARRKTPYDFEAKVAIERGRGEVVVDMLDAKERISGDSKLEAELLVYRESATPEKSQLQLSRAASGQLKADFAATEEGTYVVRVYSLADQSEQRVGATVSYSPEFARAGSNNDLLQAVAAVSGGPFGPSPKAAVEARGTAPLKAIEFWPYLLALAVLLLPLDVAIRRLSSRS